MTRQRDLKRRVRDRQVRTGESYMTALRHITGQHAASPVEHAEYAEHAEHAEPGAPTKLGAVAVVEAVDLSEIAAALGIKCRVIAMPAIAERIDASAVLRRLRTALLATPDDPALDVMRSVVLHGGRPSGTPATARDFAQLVVRARAGIGGVSDSGRMLALGVAGRHGFEMAMFMVWQVPPPCDQRPLSLMITSTAMFELAGLP